MGSPYKIEVIQSALVSHPALSSPHSGMYEAEVSKRCLRLAQPVLAHEYLPTLLRVPLSYGGSH